MSSSSTSGSWTPRRRSGPSQWTSSPPEPSFKEYPQDRDNFHQGLPSGPVPAKVPWSLVGAVVTHNEGPTTVRSVTVTYEIDGDSHHQEFDVLFNLCGYTDDPDDVECEAPDID
ncbi:hypothetical protein SAMN06296429_102220 [Janibacter indicus]|uniref:Uncharacterized protein n=1 Tax=Janibacter indicus TaxID=857417 RepID=A0A1W1YPY6_9MICO|nr:hypothetical protein SAMN06296429_102220 [Janibacter indicus]